MRPPMQGRMGQSQVIDVPSLAAGRPDRWWNADLCEVNGCVVRMGVFEGEFHWHKHDREDELFFVVSGRLLLDLEGGTVELAPAQGYTVPRGVLHRTRAERRTVVLMVEGKGVKPAGDA